MNTVTMTFCCLNYVLASGHGISPRDTNMISYPDQSLVDRLHVLIKTLKWKVMTILHNEEDLLTTTHMLDLSLSSVKKVVYNLASDNLLTCLHAIHHMMFPDINIILSGNISLVGDVIRKLDRIDETARFLTDYKHHSKLLIIAGDSSVLGLRNEIYHLENVAMIIPPKISRTFEVGMTLKHYPTGNVFTPVTECGADVSMCYFPNVRYGYNNRQIRVITLQSFNFTRITTKSKAVVYKGYSIDILDLMSKTLNFSYTLEEPEDESWGLQHNGSWDGIVKELQERVRISRTMMESDLAASELHITADRGSAIDFIYPPIYTDAVTLLYRIYPPSSIFLIALPLHWGVYVLTLMIAVIVAVQLHYTETHLASRRNYSRPFMHCCVDPISRALVKQGAHKSPVSEASKILISFWWVFLIVIAGVYSGNLSASLSSPKHVHPFKSLEEFLESDFHLVLHLQGMTMSLFNESDLAVMKHLRKKISSEAKMLTSMEEKLKMVKEDKYAVFTYHSVANLYMADDCELEIIKERFFFHHLAFAVPKESTLKIDIELVMSSLRESGTLDRLWRKWFKKRNSTACVSEKKVKPVAWEIFAEGFLILCVGIVISVLTLGYERLKCYHYH